MALRVLSFLILGLTAAAQTVSPDLIRLNQIKRHMQSEIAQVPNYTCLETVRRFHKEPKAKLLPLDWLLMEIVYSGGREWYGLPGDRTLSEQHPASFIGSGMIGNGLFGIALHNLFVADTATFTPEGEESLDGRKTVKYRFRLPRLVNRLNIRCLRAAG